MNNFLHFSNPDSPTLLVFPHAGALPFQYQEWINKGLGEYFNIYLFNKPSSQSWSDLVILVKEQLSKIKQEQFYVLGHSFGALLAYYSTIEISHKSIHLFLSGMNSPSLKLLKHFKELANRDSPSFITTLKEIGGLPQAILSNKEVLTKTAKYVQEDFKILSSINISKEHLKSKHSYSCLYYSEDPLCDLSSMSLWSKFFYKKHEMKIFKGDHFHLFHSSNEVQDYLIEQSLKSIKMS